MSTVSTDSRSLTLGRSGRAVPKIRWAALVRWLHLYFSMLGFTALLFFSWTGITLNHPTWLGASEAITRDLVGELDSELFAGDIDRLEVVETLRERHSLRGRVATFDAGADEWNILFKGPGYSADVLVNRQTASYSILETSYGTTGMLNDLHKGRDSGRVWSLIIDVSAIIMIVFSLTGLGLVFFLRRRRTPGLTVALAGTVLLCAFCYWAAV